MIALSFLESLLLVCLFWSSLLSTHMTNTFSAIKVLGVVPQQVYIERHSCCLPLRPNCKSPSKVTVHSNDSSPRLMGHLSRFFFIISRNQIDILMLFRFRMSDLVFNICLGNRRQTFLFIYRPSRSLRTSYLPIALAYVGVIGP